MLKAITIFSFLLVSKLTIYGQINGDTLYYKQNEIRVYTYVLEGDTVVKAYCSKDLPRVIRKVKTNVGRVKRDLTFDSISQFVNQHYPSASTTATNLQTGKLIKFERGVTPDFESAISLDSYWIGAINYFSAEIEKDSVNYLSYYELANACDKFYFTGPLSSSLHCEKAISYLDKCIQLKPDFEKAYLLKARVHERNARGKGFIMADPHAHIEDVEEIKRALYCLDKLLVINPANEEGKQYRQELIDKYGDRY